MRLCNKSLALRRQPDCQSSMLSPAVPAGCNDLSGEDCGYQAPHRLDPRDIPDESRKEIG
jgi:hypothetical protein